MTWRPTFLLALAVLAAGCTAVNPQRANPADAVPAHPRIPITADGSRVAWPAEGQASVSLDGRVLSSPGQTPVPIASLAKVMTAYLTVRQLDATTQVTFDADDVAETARRRARGESVVRVVDGGTLSRDQALTALLLPSANNVAVVLAERVSGSRSEFTQLMNATARQLGMTQTTYTDPSGYEASTVSTAHDQLVLLRAALRSPVLARTMGLREAELPAIGWVRSTNTLLGSRGFIAGKTGTTTAAGGCLAFRVVRSGRTLDGVLLGQRPGRPAVLQAAAALTDAVLHQKASATRGRASSSS